jgi:serine/threonine protein kinase
MDSNSKRLSFNNNNQNKSSLLSRPPQINTTTSNTNSNNNIPQFVITDIDDQKSNSTLDNEAEDAVVDMERTCKKCSKKNLKNNNNNRNKKRKTCDEIIPEEEDDDDRNEILNEFNIEEFSPNKKCANYLESYSFSNLNNSLTNSPSSSSLPSPSPTQAPSTPQTNAKKSLLAKAITNNASSSSFILNNINQEQLLLLNSPSSSSTNSSTISCMSNHYSTNSSFIGGDISPSKLSSCNSNSDQSSLLCDDCCRQKELLANNNYESLLMDEHDIEMEKDDLKQPSIKNKIQSDDDNKRRSSILSSLNAATNAQSSNNNNSNITSTPAALNMKTYKFILNTQNNSQSKMIMNTSDGLYFGRAKHNDNSQIKIFYQRKTINNMPSSDEQQNNELICVWISRDPYSDKSIIDYSLDQSYFLNKTSSNMNNQEAAAVAPINSCPYLNEYEDILTLGRGASGFVQLARRKLDKREVVTKYILRSKIYKDNLIQDERYGEVALEVSLLCKLDHPNIIKVLEVFHDRDHIQMVMEKHGCGMDLFEFIDRQRRHIDERLASYIFRQIVSAVSHLHSKMIVHRDIKDENIVINEKFHIKLIDFGSAAYMTKGKKFATFCGTMDYCSPDILLGNKYYGPELDVWTCGIALYTLIFCENPFLTAEETIECILKPPFKVSKDLMKLLFSILCPKPELRATVEEIETNVWVTQPVDINEFKWENVVRDTEFHANNAGDCYREDEYVTALNANTNFDNLAANQAVVNIPRADENIVDSKTKACMKAGALVNKPYDKENQFYNFPSNLNTNLFSKSF